MYKYASNKVTRISHACGIYKPIKGKLLKVKSRDLTLIIARTNHFKIPQIGESSKVEQSRRFYFTHLLF